MVSRPNGIRSASARSAFNSSRRAEPSDAAHPQSQSEIQGKLSTVRSVVLQEDVAEWFELHGDSPYMLLVADVVEHRRRAMTEVERGLFGIDKLNMSRSEIPAVTHVDYSARVQTVHRETNPRYHALLNRFKALTGCPVLVNTSFNVRGEPICCTPDDAFRCFMGSEIDVLVVGNFSSAKKIRIPPCGSTTEIGLPRLRAVSPYVSAKFSI